MSEPEADADNLKRRTSLPQAVLVREFGKPASFQLEAHDPGAPGPEQVRVDVHSCGISFVDVLVAVGGYQIKPALPFVPGSEASGIITAVGANVPPSRLGERVTLVGFNLGLCQVANAPMAAARNIPDRLSFDEAAIFRVSYGTAYHALVQRGRLQAGETLLVLGASGAIGYAALQVGKALGATVIASASSDAKRTFALQGGADYAIDSLSADWRARVKQATGGKGVDVIVDPVGDAATEPAFRSLAWGGRHLVIGFAGGQIPCLSTNLALLKGASLVGVDIRQFALMEPALFAKNEAAIDQLAEEGRLAPPVGHTYALGDFVAAMEAARDRHSIGRVVVHANR
ncbi:NADPH2:quinone reductase [Novosphingobium hassiacum]|uniref:NADPH2:quinone reductase n=1 Tax=Novosphingobium hassiacum TaxID=173676 RepID=A0A7W5ZVZ0_9SPHN|nr:NADPH:quinone oxidoreductase family protein [Novosphingobium hassiacum]MBB3860935.1 NADPH2:quinone reductase [Novosphingobium hassiacum]